MLVGGVVVGDQMQVETLGRAAVDEPQEFEPFLVTVALHAFADHFAGGDVKGGKQRRRPVSLVVVGHRSGPPFLHRQARLGAIQRLDLTLFVNREHQRLVRRIQVEANDIPHLVDKLLVVRQFEFLGQMGLQAMCSPDALNARRAQPTTLASLRIDQCVPAGGFWCSVMSTTCSIAAADSGGLRPARVASRSRPAAPSAT